MKPYEFHPQALEEIDDSISFYSDRQPGLGKRFLKALDAAILKIRINPLLYPKIADEIRICRLPRFPFGIIYRIGDERIEIVAVMHLKRKPGYWKTRT
ncbi:MAG: type II toxin-antitoxin system RelE/ParE family toxin [Desulfatirhabdiaceae bacterium]